jgi:hypothetical protein
MTALDNDRRDEETPLLQSDQETSLKEPTPIPWRQVILVLIIQCGEPLTSQVISPFAPEVSLSILLPAPICSMIGALGSLYVELASQAVMRVKSDFT